MITEDDMSQFFNPLDRQNAIDAVFSEDLQKVIRGHWRSLDLLPPPYQTIPQSLWGIVPLIVETVSDDGEGDTEYIEANETTIRKYGRHAAPGLMQVDYVSLQAHEAQRYAAYVTSYIDYLSGQSASLSSRLAELESRYKALLDLLPSYVREDIKGGIQERRRIVRADPFMRRVQEQIVVLTEEKKRIDTVIDLLETRARQVSRDLERRRQELQAGTAGNYGAGPQPREQWQPSAQRSRTTSAPPRRRSKR